MVGYSLYSEDVSSITNFKFPILWNEISKSLLQKFLNIDKHKVVHLSIKIKKKKNFNHVFLLSENMFLIFLRGL